MLTCSQAIKNWVENSEIQFAFCETIYQFMTQSHQWKTHQSIRITQYIERNSNRISLKILKTIILTLIFHQGRSSIPKKKKKKNNQGWYCVNLDLSKKLLTQSLTVEWRLHSKMRLMLGMMLDKDKHWILRGRWSRNILCPFFFATKGSVLSLLHIHLFSIPSNIHSTKLICWLFLCCCKKPKKKKKKCHTFDL
jgi:hypothetical protein